MTIHVSLSQNLTVNLRKVFLSHDLEVHHRQGNIPFTYLLAWRSEFTDMNSCPDLDTSSQRHMNANDHSRNAFFLQQ